MGANEKNTDEIVAALRGIADLIAAGLPAPVSINPGHSQTALQFSRDGVAAVNAWAAEIGATPELDPYVYDKGEPREWQNYGASGALAGYPVRVWTGRTVTA